MQLEDLAGIRKAPRQQQRHLREMSGRQQPEEIRHVRGPFGFFGVELYCTVRGGLSISKLT